MFAQTVQFRMKPQLIDEMASIFNREIIPLLRQQEGFQDEITFIVPSGLAAVGISLWSEKEQMDSYIRNVYPTVLKSLAGIFRGVPKVQTFEVSNSTFHTLPLRSIA